MKRLKVTTQALPGIDYDVETVDVPVEVGILKRRGADGWNLIAAVPCGAGCVQLLMKRPKEARRPNGVDDCKAGRTA